MTDFIFVGTPDYANMPSQTTPVMDENGTMNMAWYRFFNALQKKCGLNPDTAAGNVNRVGATYSRQRVVAAVLYKGGPNASTAIYSEGALHYLNVYDVRTGQLVGLIQFSTWLGP